ncbi:N-acetylglucosamine-6-phosphate deacetylase [Rhodococcoides trifolii]|uniref:N-acetylglucosamine-6-phosphate deacetylase n=1 Tax=Rhodococcoides trifolii TaxID=908250 RepID=A0A917CX83_9NOCA|nr:amidohydrolase family protein [Rhodococcus trifolii]GGG00847.1 N-acetylglucosamine-6-phosphate deacetylase [Rhodococcus trifolii]
MTQEFLRGRVVAEDGIVDDGVVTTRDGVITAVRAAQPDDAPAGPDTTIIPGLVDVHCHGGGGQSFPDSDSVMDAVLHHRRHGTTTMLASLVSAPSARLLQRTAVLADLYERDEIAGIHLEGPFISAACCGAQDPASIVDGDPELLRDLIDAGRGSIKSMTLAPETGRFDELVEVMRGAGMVASIGHTNADATVVRHAFEKIGGPASATHLFNGMPQFHHRSPGPVGACLAAAGAGAAVLELIGDGVHLADDTVRMVFDLVGPDRIAFVSDAMAAAGMPDGRYRLGALDVQVTGGTARLAEGSHAIAGGTSNVLDIVRRAVVHAGVGISDAVRAGSRTPALLLGMNDVGRIAVGARADIVVTDADLRPVRVMRHGDWVKGVY